MVFVVCSLRAPLFNAKVGQHHLLHKGSIFNAKDKAMLEVCLSRFSVELDALAWGVAD